MVFGGLIGASQFVEKMEHPPMALTDTAIRKIKPADKSLKLTDSSGLYLLIKPNG